MIRGESATARAHRTGPGRRYVEALTGLRGVAAVFVFLFHYHHFNPELKLHESVPLLGPVLQFPLGFGFMGVDLFFVLSGFLLSLPFAAAAAGLSPDPSLRRYFRRRVLRVFPAYYAQLAIILLAATWFVAFKPLDGLALLGHLVMFFNAGPEPIRPMVGVWWTLPVEFSFYLLLPLIASLMCPRRWWLFLPPALALAIAYRLWAAANFAEGNPLMLAANHLPGSLPEFLLGASAAVLVQARRGHAARELPAWLLDTILLASMVLVAAWFWLIVLPHGTVYWRGHWSMVVAPSVLGLLLAALVWSVYSGSRLAALLFANPVVHFLGLISYSLYLWHFVVMQQLLAVFGESYEKMDGMVKFLFTTMTVLLVAWMSYWIIERPFYQQHRYAKGPESG